MACKHGKDVCIPCDAGMSVAEAKRIVREVRENDERGQTRYEADQKRRGR